MELSTWPFLRATHVPTGKSSAAERARASTIEAATCDRFGNPVLRLGVNSGVGRALAAQEDFQKQLPAFARFKERSASFQMEDAAESDTSAQGAISGCGNLWIDAWPRMFDGIDLLKTFWVMGRAGDGSLCIHLRAMVKNHGETGSNAQGAACAKAARGASSVGQRCVRGDCAYSGTSASVCSSWNLVQ